MDYEVVNDIRAEDIYYLRKLIGWKDLPVEQFEKGVKNTMCSVTVRNNEDVIAVGRIVGDYASKGLLTDIMVNPKYQKQGFGKIVVTNLLEQALSFIKEGEQLHIEGTPTSGNRDFYVRCGMKYKPENQDGVYIWLKK